MARLPAIASDRPTWLASLASLASPRILGWPRASRQRDICWLVRLLSTLTSNQADEQATVYSLLRNSIAMHSGGRANVPVARAAAFTCISSDEPLHGQETAFAACKQNFIRVVVEITACKWQGQRKLRRASDSVIVCIGLHNCQQAVQVDLALPE